MEFSELIQKRRSIRRFQARSIDQETLESLLFTVNSAPSAGDLQSYEVVVVSDKSHIAALAEAAGDQEFIKTAPIVLVFCADPSHARHKYGERGANLYCVQDATIAATYAQLAAVDLGLATTWVGAFEEKAVKKIVGGLVPICILPVGYPAEQPPVTTRRSLHDLIHYEHL